MPKSTIVHGWHQKGFVVQTEEAEEAEEEEEDVFAFCSKLSSFKSAGLGTDEEDASSKKNVSFSATTFASKSSSSTFSSLVFSFVSLSFSFSSSLKKNDSFFDDLNVAALFFQFVFVCL